MQHYNRKALYWVVILFLLAGCSSSRLSNSAAKSYEIGEYHLAIDKYLKSYRSENDAQKRLEFDYQLANAYWHIDDYKKAELRLRNLIRKEYPDSSLLLRYAHTLRYTQKYDDAIEIYNQFLKEYPDNQEAKNGIESCKKTPEWLEKLTRFEVTHERLLSSRDADYSPYYASGLDNSVVFTSTREGGTGKKKSAITGQRNGDIFKSNFDIQRQRWEKPSLIEEKMLINTNLDEGAASFSKDGQTMYFTRCEFDRKGSKGAAIFKVIRSKDTWADAENLKVVPDSLIAAHPSISYDGLTLYFVSDMDGGFGGKDIWKVEQLSEGWGQPINLGSEINTPGDEMFPFIRDNGELYFSSDYHVGMGGFDIFKAVLDPKSKQWKVSNMRAPINSLGDDFGIAFVPGRDQGMFTSNRKGSLGDDLYSFILPPKIYRTEGEIVDSETESRLNNATIRIIGTDGTMLKVRSNDGKFQYRMAPETDYIFAAFKEGYLNAKQIISTTDLPESKNFTISLKLTPTDAPINVDNINYEFGKADLLPGSITALDSLVDLLNINPTIVVEIMSHTDFVGSEQFNSELSQKRAQGVVNYLITKGINPKRLVAKGYGETWPKTVTRKMSNQNDFLKRGDVLTEAFIMKLSTEAQQEIAKAINRRTDFRVLSNDFRE